MKTGYSIKTWKMRLFCPEKQMIETTEALYREAVAFYYELLKEREELWAENLLTIQGHLEKLTVPGRDGREPKYIPPGGKLPVYFRRSAMNKAAMAVKTAASAERFPEKIDANITFFKGMYRDLTDTSVVLKVWNGKKWIWVPCGLTGRPFPKEAAILSPTLVHEKKWLMFHVPVRQENSDARTAKERMQEGARVCSVRFTNKAFVEPMNNVDVSAVYDIYITFAILALYIYGTKMNRRLVSRATERNSVLRNENEKPWIYVFGIASPVLYVLLSGNVSKFLIYSSMNLRGVSGQDNLILNSLILVSLFCTCIMLFSGRITAKKMCILALITFILAWLQGKRFIIAVMGVFYLFFLTKSELEEKGRKRTFWILPIMVITLIAFSAFYLAVIKPLSNMNFDSVYDMLRVDFGRDDVIKYVIYKEFFKQNHILDYPGQSFFSTLFIFIPRIIWPSKPLAMPRLLSVISMFTSIW